MDGEIVELVQQLIRNACVSDGDPSVGEEERNATVLHAVLAAHGVPVETVALTPGRPAVVGRLEGRDPDAPSLALLGHTDVVPADGEGWDHDPFGGELIDGEVWGRGAVDMLNQTAAMALAVGRLVRSGFRPSGDLLVMAVPDEECGGRKGARQLIEEHRDLVVTDYALTEVGGAVDGSRAGTPRIEAYVAEKGNGRLDVATRGTPGHSSLPWGSDNALVKAAEVVRRIQAWRPQTRISDAWRAWVAAQDFDAATAALLVDADRLWDGLARLPPDLAVTAHACTHTTIVPTMVAGGEKVNIIPGRVELTTSIRTPMGEDCDAVLAEVRGLLADVVAGDDVTVDMVVEGSASSIDTPLWPVLEAVAAAHHPGARLMPSVLAASTDARWLRPEGTVVYGYGLLSARVPAQEYWSRFHGRNERIDVDSLAMSVQAWEDVARRFLG